MGWLRDFMHGATPSISSFGKLAERCLAHEYWPSDIQLKHRSLSTLFSKLDRKQELDWLRDRLEVQQVLTDLTGRPLLDLRAILGDEPYDGQGKFVRLNDIRFARELDLIEEALPPGIPTTAHTPPNWTLTWWIAPPGSGCGLNRLWLEARGLAHGCIISSYDELKSLPSRGALFIQIDPALLEEEFPLTLDDLLQIRAWDRPICFAASFEPPALAVPPGYQSFTRLYSKAPASYLPELVDWVKDRVGDNGHFHADRAETWIRKVALPAGAVTQLGDAMGLLGMLDEFSPRSLLARSLDEIGEHFVKRRIREALEKTSSSPKLADHAFEALKQCAARLLVSGTATLDSPQVIDDWTTLLSSPNAEDAPDPEWFTSALSGALGTQISRQELRRAAGRLKPSAFQLTRSLEAAGLLVPSQKDSKRHDEGVNRKLRPHWLVTLLSSRAAQTVLHHGPRHWGRVLVIAKQHDAVIAALFASAKRGDFEACFTAVDDFDSEEIELVAAIEGALIATGLALLEGHDVPSELSEALLALSSEGLFLIDQLPEARLAYKGKTASLFERSYFLVALMAHCQCSPLPLKRFDPFRSKSPAIDAHFQQALMTVLANERENPLRSKQLLSLLTVLCSESPSLPACLQLLRCLDTVAPVVFMSAYRECSLDAIVLSLRDQGSKEQSILRALWRFLAIDKEPSSYFISTELKRKLWHQLPSDALLLRIERSLVVDWNNLLPHQYSEWFNSGYASALPFSAAANCPLDAAFLCIKLHGAHEFQPQTLAKIMDRLGARIAPHIKQLIEQKKAVEIECLLENAPNRLSHIIAQQLPSAPELLSTSEQILHLVQAFLFRAVQERHIHFNECYLRLAAIEKGVRPLRHLNEPGY